MSSLNKKITYRYGIGERHEIVDIYDLSEPDRHKQKIYCLSCGHELLPVLGKVRERHFRHTKDFACDGETYLHKLSKELIRKRFLSPLPFRIPVEHRLTCCLSNKCKLPFDRNACCETQTIRYDLKNDYDQIFLEEPIENFIADILLKDSTGKHQPFLIEIKVTHQCTDDKLKSGLPIYEIPVATEDQAVGLLTGDLFTGTLSNFSLPASLTAKPIQREWLVDLFVLYRSGKTHNERKLKICSNVLETNNRDVLLEYVCLQLVSPNLRYQGFLMKARELGFDIKDCRLCSRYRTPYGCDSSNVCIMYKKEHLPKHPDLRSAYGCPHYSPIQAETIDSSPYVTVDNRIAFVQSDFVQIYSKEQNRGITSTSSEQVQTTFTCQPSEELYIEENSSTYVKKNALSVLQHCFEKGMIQIAYRRPDYGKGADRIDVFIDIDKYVVHNLNSLFDKCKIHVKPNRFCLELYNDNIDVSDHLFITFLYKGEAVPQLKKKSAYVIFIWLDNEFTVQHLITYDDNILIKEGVDANFMNIDGLHEKLEQRDLDSEL